jgi:hypothetical protein
MSRSRGQKHPSLYVLPIPFGQTGALFNGDDCTRLSRSHLEQDPLRDTTLP